MAYRDFVPEYQLPPSVIDRWSYTARFQAYQGKATVSLNFYDETRPRRNASKFLLIPTTVRMPEDISELRQGLLDVILDWGILLGSECRLPKSAE